MPANGNEVRRDKKRFGLVPEFREPPTFSEWFGAVLASRFLTQESLLSQSVGILAAARIA
jgi:hypothetical protein